MSVSELKNFFFPKKLQKICKFPSSSFPQGLKGDRGLRGPSGRVGSVVRYDFGHLWQYYTSLIFQMLVTQTETM